LEGTQTTSVRSGPRGLFGGEFFKIYKTESLRKAWDTGRSGGRENVGEGDRYQEGEKGGGGVNGLITKSKKKLSNLDHQKLTL